MTLHGLDLSYFTGKLQAYLRYAGLPFAFAEMDSAAMRRTARATGMAQMPALELADGRWMTDTTAIIAWVEARRGPPAVIPPDPALAFVSRLVEDYADEWLWRPALHYRWSYGPDTALMGRRIAAEMLRDVPLPLGVRTALIIRRQQAKYVRGDGVTSATRAHVEDIYRRNLGWLEAMLAVRPFLLGDRPSLADFGFMGPMFRHFSLDPTPARIMRDAAPGVYAWVARVWNARASELAQAPLLAAVPADWSPLLRDIGVAYLPYLAANAAAARAGASDFDFALDGVPYRLPVNPYRVHCLAELQRGVRALDPAAAAAVEERLAAEGAWEPLWREPAPESGFDPDGRLPFLAPGRAWRTPPARRTAHTGAGR